MNSRQIAWFRNDLLKTHWYNYLNLLSMGDPRAALVTKGFQEDHNVNIGDSLWISWGTGIFRGDSLRVYRLLAYI